MLFRPHGHHRPVADVAGRAGRQAQLGGQPVAAQFAPQRRSIHGIDQPRPALARGAVAEQEGLSRRQVDRGHQLQLALRGIERRRRSPLRPRQPATVDQHPASAGAVEKRLQQLDADSPTALAVVQQQAVLVIELADQAHAAKGLLARGLQLDQLQRRFLAARGLLGEQHALVLGALQLPEAETQQQRQQGQHQQGRQQPRAKARQSRGDGRNRHAHALTARRRRRTGRPRPRRRSASTSWPPRSRSAAPARNAHAGCGSASPAASARRW
ncbi:hypothetical protein D3C75_736360 [compost metagenome]